MYKPMNKNHLKCLILGLVVVMIACLLTGFDVTRKVTVEYDGQKKELITNETDPALVLQSAGVDLGHGDSWRLDGSSSRLRDGSIIKVVRAKEITIVRNGKEEVCYSSKNNVGQVLKDLGISFKKKGIYPNASTSITDGMKIYVLNKGEELHFGEAPIEIPTEYIEDYNRKYGEDLIKRRGAVGKSKVISKKITNKDGSHSFTELGREVLQQPEPKVVLKGMAMSVKTPDGYKRYKKKIIAEASAYVATGNRTATGLVPYVGIVAVDPRVIPLYTKMYIPGYGIAMAGDTGGYIIGNRIDLFYDDYNAAIHFGRRNVEVYILED